MRFYLDEHLPPALADMLRARGHDCLTTQHAGRTGSSDEDQLTFAAGQHRVLVTFNRTDFLLLSQVWATEGHHHAGIILSKQLHASVVFRHLLRLIARHRRDDLSNQALWPPELRRLPGILNLAA